MSSTVCPKCKGCLEQVTCAGIEVDRCLHCQGLWFDPLEAEQLKAVRGSEKLDVGDPQRGAQLDRIDKDIPCPRCRVCMRRMVDIDQHSVWYERCPRCSGVWLDAGEFKKYKDNFTHQGVLNQLRSKLRAKKPIKRQSASRRINDFRKD